MSKAQRASNPNRQSRSRVDFKISNLQALQVPKGWDRLVVSLIHVETGKVMGKLGKAQVRNGGCQWAEALSESIHITRDESSKEYDESLVRLIVSSGSTRSSILGEATINLGQFAASSRIPAAVSQPLKKCIYGTILQLKIQCVVPRSKTGDEESKSSSHREKDRDTNNHDADAKSYTSDNSCESGPKADLTSTPMNLNRKETSQISNENRAGGIYDTSKLPNHHLLDSSKNHLEASGQTVGELRAEAKMWERNARKLMVDLDLSRKELSDLSKKHSDSTIELSAAHAEREFLEREVEKLKLELEKSTQNQCALDAIARSENLSQMQKVLENEMRYQQDLNENIGQQLKRSQESNAELVSVLQTLEQTIQQQRIEIENLSSLKKSDSDFKLLEQALRDKTEDLENERKSNRENLLLLEKDYEFKLSAKEEEIASLEATFSGYVKGEHFEALDDSNEHDLGLAREIEMLRQKVEELEKDCGELTDENLELLFKLKDLNRVAGIRKCSSFDSISSEHPPTVCPSDESEAGDSKFLFSAKTEHGRNVEALERKKNELESEKISGLESQIAQLKEECVKEKGENVSLRNSNMEASSEISRLLAEKAELQDSFQEAQSRVELIENKVIAIVRESELKVEDLNDRLSSSEQSRENLAAENERHLELLESYRISEEKLKIELNELESERQKITMELGNEISILKDELEKCEADKRKLELESEIVSTHFEELKAENAAFREKISLLQDAISDFDECKRTKSVLEEKLHRVEASKEIISIENEEIRNEMNEIKKENERYQKKSQALEEELKLIKERDRKLHKEGAKKCDFQDQSHLPPMDHDKNRGLQKSRKPNSVSPKKPPTIGEAVAKERYERTKSSLEAELRDLRERYLQMSLKYAEVESEREDLVMRLKATKGGKRWFS